INQFTKSCVSTFNPQSRLRNRDNEPSITSGLRPHVQKGDVMSSFRMRLVFHEILFLSLLCIPLAYSQTSTASLTGTIHDATGAVLPGVSVTVTDIERNTSLSALSNDAGSYVIPVLNPGTYSVTAEFPGFKRFLQEGVVLQVAQVARLDVTMEVGQFTLSI